MEGRAPGSIRGEGTGSLTSQGGLGEGMVHLVKLPLVSLGPLVGWDGVEVLGFLKDLEVSAAAVKMLDVPKDDVGMLAAQVAGNTAGEGGGRGPQELIAVEGGNHPTVVRVGVGGLAKGLEGG